MAAPATNGTLSAIEFFDNAVHHEEHFTSSLLGVFVVFFPLIGYVTVPTSHAQGIGEEVHDHRHPASRNAFQCLDIMEHLFRRLVLVFVGDVKDFFSLMRRVFWIGDLAGVRVMTSPAAYPVLAGKIGLVDETDHAEHFSRGFLGRLVVLLPFVLRVAVSTRDAEIAADGIHCNQHLGRRLAFECLNALENVFGTHRAVHAEL